MPACSIIIPVYNNASLTRQCLNRLFTQLPREHKSEFIVVDDASADLTPEFLKAYADRIRVITHPINRGYAVSCNDAAAAANGEYLIFLNNDTLPEPGWLDTLVDYAENHPRAAVVGSKLLYPDDRVQHAGVIIAQDHLPRHIYVGFPRDHPAVNQSRRFQIVTAACALVRRDIFHALGGFDEAFVNGYEDVDFCLRVGARGQEVHYCHKSVVYHFETMTRAAQGATVMQNTELYLQRWRDRVRPDDWDYYVRDGMVNLEYDTPHPLRLEVAPRFAVINRQEREQATDQLRNDQPGRMFELLRQNIRLDAGQAAPAMTLSAALPASAAPRGEQYKPALSFVRPSPDTLYAALPAGAENLVGAGDFKQLGEIYLRYFIELGGLKRTDQVLDVGCGIGRMAIPLTGYLERTAHYEGFDTVQTGIDWCQQNITPLVKNFHFRRADLYNRFFNPTGRAQPSEYRFQYADESFDFVFLTSVFTHMPPDDMENYLAEVERVLKPGGRCFATYFILNAESRQAMSQPPCDYNFRANLGVYSVLNAEIPEAGIAYEEDFLRQIYRKYSLALLEPIYFGTWCRKHGIIGQDIVVAYKPNAKG